jgi:hypothetical protein
VLSLHIPHFTYYYNTDLAQSHTSRSLHITMTGVLSHSSMLQTLLISADRCNLSPERVATTVSRVERQFIVRSQLVVLKLCFGLITSIIRPTGRDYAANNNTWTRPITDTVWTVSVDPEKHARYYSGKIKRNYSTPSFIKLDIFVWVSLKTGRFSIPVGRPGDVIQNRVI